MSDESTPEDPATGDPALPPPPAVPAWNPQPWASEPAPSGWVAAPPTTAQLVVEEPPRGKRRWLRRTLLTLLVLLTITGLVGGGMAYAKNRREDRERRAEAARVAAEKKAAAAYVVAVRPMAVRVFDDVQPLQDVYDAYAHPRPGLSDARDDVIQHGGALRDLKSVKLVLSRLHVPATYTADAEGLRLGIAGFVDAAGELEHASHDKVNRHGYIPAFGSAFESLALAESAWASAISALDVNGKWPAPYETRSKSRGRNVPTASSFILASDLACGRALDALEFEDYKHPDRAIRTTFPKFSKEIQGLVTRLRAVKQPSGKSAYRHRLEIGWSASVDAAKQFDALSTAYRRRQVVAYERASKRLKDALEQMEDLGRAYQSQGVTACLYFFGGGDSKKGSSTTTA